MKPLPRAPVPTLSTFLSLSMLLTALPAQAANSAHVTKSYYGTTSTGAPVDQYTLTNANGLEVTILTYGAIVTAIRNPQRNMPNIVLGFASISDYETLNSPGPHFGATIGRYANRIAYGVFTLNGTTYCLDINNPPNSLHGGFKGFDTKVWTVTEVINQGNEAGIQLNYLSPVGDGWTGQAPNPYCPPNGVYGFPGNLNTFVTYTLNNNDQLVIDYSATTDAPTVLNLTNHTYWNLAGEGTGTIYSEVVTLNANQFTPVNSVQIPTGSISDVSGTLFDFRNGKTVEADIRTDDPQLAYGKGFDLNWVVNRPQGIPQLVLAATVHDPVSNRSVNVWTTQPGVQFYSGNSLDGSLYGTSNRAYRQSDGLAFETQHYPDSPNHPDFPTTVLNPGQEFTSKTVFEILTGGGSPTR